MSSRVREWGKRFTPGRLSASDKVRFIATSKLAVGLKLRDQVGVVVEVHDYPGQGGLVVDVRFGDNLQRGIRMHELELVS
jgi:hypothetical protein